MAECNERIRLISVVGPTASGKTALAIELALRLGGEVVSCDSMQIYRGMEIATAAPTPGEQRGVRHHLISCIDPAEQFSVARYCDLAHECIADISARGGLPIVCGGTGLYYSSLVNNLEFLDAPASPVVREKYERLAREEGGERLLGLLEQIDPKSAQTLHPNQLGRIIRALEIYELTGMSKSEQDDRSRSGGDRYDLKAIGITFRDRSRLYERINKRVDIMLESGIIEEAKEFMARKVGTAVQAIGHKELEPYIRGECTLEEAAERLKRETRRYAKRQLTWFRRDERIHWLYSDECGGGELPEQALAILGEEEWINEKA